MQACLSFHTQKWLNKDDDKKHSGVVIMIISMRFGAIRNIIDFRDSYLRGSSALSLTFASAGIKNTREWKISFCLPPPP